MNTMNRYTYYNPTTNEISSRWKKGFESCGDKKFSEAMTYVNDDLRFELWSKTKNSEYRGIPLDDMSARLRNQLQRIGVKSIPKTLYYKKERTPGLDLLRKILKKQK